MSARLHVAVDTTNLKGDWRGITRYVRAVFPRLAARPDVRLTMVGPRLFGYSVPRSADVVWHPANGTFFDSCAPSVVTFHDAVPFRFAADDPKLRANEQRPWLRSAATATAFLANSQFTASEIATFLGIDAGRQTVAPLAVDEALFSPNGPRAALRDGAPFILFVGTGASVKNVGTLLEAHARAFPKDEVKLVIAGSAPPPGSRAHALGVLSASKLATWYRAALLVAVPSLYEGFGLPLLEALACGRAVVASRVGALPEVGGSACGWIDDPRDVEAWSGALRALADDEAVRREFERAAIERAALFSWDRCTARTFSVLQAAAQSR